jgi:PAS domain S-box-containing protein
MHNLRIQLLISHMILMGLMVVVMVGAVFSFFHLGHSIDHILKNNYRSVIAAQNMKETLERQDSAATFFLAGQVGTARRQYEVNRKLFDKAYHAEATNITEPGEGAIAQDIGQQFAAYQKAMSRLLYANPPMPMAQARKYYFSVLEGDFLRLKGRAQDVLDLNQNAILKADTRARLEARRSSLMGAGVTILAIVLAAILAFTLVRAALGPLRSLARQAEAIGAGHLDQRIDLRRTDEMGVLAQSFNRMAQNLREARRLEEQRLHRAERMSDAALESLYDPVLVTDAQARVVHLNRAAEGLFGPENDAVGRPIDQVVQDHRLSQAMEHAVQHESVSASEDEAGQVPLLGQDGQRIYQLRATPMRDSDGAVLGATMVLEDITHLRELDRLKTEFISVASHELRTPVTSLMLSVQLLDEGALGPLSPEQKDVVNAQKDELQRLDRMMRDLLDIARLEAGVTPPRFEIVAPSDLAHSAMQSVSSQAEAGGVILESHMPANMPAVRADRAQISRVLVNLLNNAVRHTPHGGHVNLEATVAGSQVEITVRDTGPGIPPEYLPRIFERFVQVPGTTRGGAGLGLAIAQTIVRAHGSLIQARSQLGKGSEFSFSLPTPEERRDQRWPGYS